MPGAHNIGAAISGPRITGGNFMDTTLFLTKTGTRVRSPKPPLITKPPFYLRVTVSLSKFGCRKGVEKELGDQKPHSQGPLNGGVSNGGVSRSGLVLPFFVLFCPFGTFPGIFPICSGMLRGFSRFVLFLFLGPFKSTYEEQSRKGPRHNLDLSRKKWETPGFGNTPV